MAGDIFTDNTRKKRYELQLEEGLAYIEYIKAQNKVYLTHTEVPRKAEGKGLGSRIVRLALKDIEDHGLELVPLCPFVALYLQKHPEWRRLVMKGIHLGD